MASRMDRYYKTELVSRERSSKNKSLYKEIGELDNYSNIEGVANIENSNEIDISKVREMLKRRDDYKKQRRYSDVNNDNISSNFSDELDDNRSYDINSVLSKISDKSKDEKYRSLDNSQYEALKNVKNRKEKFDIEKEENELKELIHTLYASKTQIQEKLSAAADESDDVGLLDDLKSDTMVGDAASIKSILDEEKKTLPEVKEEIDNSFYTKSFGFTQKDFEELKDMNHTIKKGNKFIIVLLVALIILVIVVACVFFLPKFINFNF